MDRFLKRETFLLKVQHVRIIHKFLSWEWDWKFNSLTNRSLQVGMVSVIVSTFIGSVFDVQSSPEGLRHSRCGCVAAASWGDPSTKHLHTKHVNVGLDRSPFQVKVNIAANDIYGVKIKILSFRAFIEIKRCTEFRAQLRHFKCDPDYKHYILYDVGSRTFWKTRDYSLTMCCILKTWHIIPLC